jgi:hypothetical protein
MEEQMKEIVINDRDLDWDYGDGFYRTYELTTRGYDLKSCIAASAVREFNANGDVIDTIAADDLPIRMYELIERIILKELNKAARIEHAAIEELIVSYNTHNRRKS